MNRPRTRHARPVTRPRRRRRALRRAGPGSRTSGRRRTRRARHRARHGEQGRYTLQDGGLSEVYYPDLGTPSVCDLRFVVTDGRTFTERDSDATVTHLADPHALVYVQTDTEKSGRWRITKTYVTDPPAVREKYPATADGRRAMLQTWTVTTNGPRDRRFAGRGHDERRVRQPSGRHWRPAGMRCRRAGIARTRRSLIAGAPSGHG